MRKPDEIAFYDALRKLADTNGYCGGHGPVTAAYRALDIPPKRAHALLMKWSDNGWWDWGLWAWGGWFTPEAPAELTL